MSSSSSIVNVKRLQALSLKLLAERDTWRTTCLHAQEEASSLGEDVDTLSEGGQWAVGSGGRCRSGGRGEGEGSMRRREGGAVGSGKRQGSRGPTGRGRRGQHESGGGGRAAPGMGPQYLPATCACRQPMTTTGLPLWPGLVWPALRAVLLL